MFVGTRDPISKEKKHQFLIFNPFTPSSVFQSVLHECMQIDYDRDTPTENTKTEINAIDLAT